MKDSRKQAVSIRMNGADVRKVKRLAQRFGARDSDVIRFAVKAMLNKLAPLNDPDVRGRSLLPVFVEAGSELLRFFDLDAMRLEAIINDGVEPARRVERDDIALLALNGAREPYAALLLSELNNPELVRQERQRPVTSELSETLRQYLYDKYVYRGNADARPIGDESPRLAAVGGSCD